MVSRVDVGAIVFGPGGCAVVRLSSGLGVCYICPTVQDCGTSITHAQPDINLTTAQPPTHTSPAHFDCCLQPSITTTTVFCHSDSSFAPHAVMLSTLCRVVCGSFSPRTQQQWRRQRLQQQPRQQRPQQGRCSFKTGQQAWLQQQRNGQAVWLSSSRGGCRGLTRSGCRRCW